MSQAATLQEGRRSLFGLPNTLVKVVRVASRITESPLRGWIKFGDFRGVVANANGGTTRSPFNVHPMAPRATSRCRTASYSVPLESEQSAADRRHGRRGPGRVPVDAAGLGDGQIAKAKIGS